MGNRIQAVIDMEWMRKTHTDWAAYFERYPDLEAQYVASGDWDDAKEHRRIAAMYDNAIECLRGDTAGKSSDTE